MIIALEARFDCLFLSKERIRGLKGRLLGCKAEKKKKNNPETHLIEGLRKAGSINNMRILFVTPYPPSPTRVRSYGFIRQLQQHHEIRVLTLCTTERERADVEALQRQGIAVSAMYEPMLEKVLRGAAAYYSAKPLQVAFDASPLMRSALRLFLAGGTYDLLHFESVRTLGMLPAPPERLPVPCVWDAVDCMSLLYEQGAAHGATMRMRLVGNHEARRLRAYERLYLRRFRHVLTTSQREREALLANARLCLPGSSSGNEQPLAEISVVPHGVDPSFFSFSGEGDDREPETLVFSGRMGFHANISAVLSLVDDIMPILWHTRPTTRLVIAGSEPPRVVRTLTRDPRIQVTGYLPDLRPTIARARVAVCPLPYAVGVQNKVLEAMALGTPVVTTSSAVGGLVGDVRGKLHIADNPPDFAAKVLALLEDQILWQKFSLWGKAYAMRHYSWDAIAQQLVAVYTDTIEDAYRQAFQNREADL
jgi:glycosyltransferase involved in cell wall biosynthesis